MSGRRLTRGELEQIYPRSMFPNQLAWETTINGRLEDNAKTCVGCPHFLEIDFDVDNALSFEGICKRKHIAIPHKYYVTCKD